LRDEPVKIGGYVYFMTNPAMPGHTKIGMTRLQTLAFGHHEDRKLYMLALTSNADGTGQIEPIAQFMANPAGAQIVNAVGPIRQIVDPSPGPA
jgi:hypothetical protein